MKSVITTAKTIDKAIEEGLKQLNTSLENVNVNILSEGGLLKKAKVELVLIDKTEEKEVIKETKKEEVIDLENENFTEEESEELKKLASEVNLKEKKDVENENIKNKILEFLNGLIYAYNVYAEVSVEKNSKGFVAKINGENLGALIGKHGEAMEALQLILNTYLYNKTDFRKKVFLDVENYREKRSETLKEMALKLAEKVKSSKKSYKLEPMNSYERRIIHEALSKDENISTHSEGEEPNRFLVIEYVENKL